MVDHSGAGAAVGPVYERESIPYEAVEIPGLAGVPTFGIDGPPALAVIVACIEGFGPRPDLVVSGINHGVNAGRSALHSGTVGATLTGAQFGVRGLAVSIAWGEDPVPWETPVALAAGILPTLAGRHSGHRPEPQRAGGAPGPAAGHPPRDPGTVGLIRACAPEATPEPVAGTPIDRTAGVDHPDPPGDGRGRRPHRRAGRVGARSPMPRSIAEGWATVTPLLRGPRGRLRGRRGRPGRCTGRRRSSGPAASDRRTDRSVPGSTRRVPGQSAHRRRAVEIAQRGRRSLQWCNSISHRQSGSRAAHWHPPGAWQHQCDVTRLRRTRRSAVTPPRRRGNGPDRQRSTTYDPHPHDRPPSPGAARR